MPQFTMELDVALEANSADEAEELIFRTLSHVSTSVDITEGPNEVISDDEEDEADDSVGA